MTPQRKPRKVRKVRKVRTARRSRDREATRARLLAAGFDEVYQHGFQAASVDDMLRRLDLTKGAFFHHFESKLEFGYALVDEVVAEMIRAQWVMPLATADDPLTIIGDAFEGGARALAAAPVNLGCPLNNLAQEMSPLDDGFRLRTQQVFELWMQTYELALRRGQASGTVSAAIDPQAAAFALVAEIEGILSLSKNSQDPRALTIGARNLRRRLDAMRP
ncbi:MAG TPA: TetR/AcrR family transcriptional regulator [Gemmatimonadaceae bacterium]|nr:TetR/AcrR family transcriptional regulator [Gemmatimonadaceae bacterium]